MTVTVAGVVPLAGEMVTPGLSGGDREIGMVAAGIAEIVMLSDTALRLQNVV